MNEVVYMDPIAAVGRIADGEQVQPTTHSLSTLQAKTSRKNTPNSSHSTTENDSINTYLDDARKVPTLALAVNRS